jgi:uncharacterized protein YceK
MPTVKDFLSGYCTGKCVVIYRIASKLPSQECSSGVRMYYHSCLTNSNSKWKSKKNVDLPGMVVFTWILLPSKLLVIFTNIRYRM